MVIILLSNQIFQNYFNILNDAHIHVLMYSFIIKNSNFKIFI